jgi:hypothetical protein
MNSLEKYLKELIKWTLTEEQIEQEGMDNILERLENSVVYEIANKKEWWQDKIKEMI